MPSNQVQVEIRARTAVGGHMFHDHTWLAMFGTWLVGVFTRARWLATTAVLRLTDSVQDVVVRVYRVVCQ